MKIIILGCRRLWIYAANLSVLVSGQTDENWPHNRRYGENSPFIKKNAPALSSAKSSNLCAGVCGNRHITYARKNSEERLF
jgi:hypothetical protein